MVNKISPICHIFSMNDYNRSKKDNKEITNNSLSNGNTNTEEGFSFEYILKENIIKRIGNMKYFGI